MNDKKRKFLIRVMAIVLIALMFSSVAYYTFAVLF